MNATQTGLESAFAGSQEFILRICNGKPIAANTAPPIINNGASTPPEVPDPSATAQTKAFNAAILTRSGDLQCACYRSWPERRTAQALYEGCRE
jgi:hypothetical protein